MRALSEKRLSDYMAQQIADEILSGRIVGGTQLKQEELAEVFGASRIPIREAFQTGIDCPSGNEKNLRSRIIGRTDSDYL